MNKHHDRFDPVTLTKIKNDHCGYQFCPRCGVSLQEQVLDGLPRMACPDENCGFVFYHNPVPAAGAVVVENDQILMVKRAHPPRIGWWCFPAGFMEWGEHPRDTAVREVREETGLEVELGDFFEVYCGDDDPRTNAILLLFHAQVIGGELCPADDAQDVRFFAFDDLPDKIAFESHIQALADYNERFRRKS